MKIVVDLEAQWRKYRNENSREYKKEYARLHKVRIKKQNQKHYQDNIVHRKQLRREYYERCRETQFPGFLLGYIRARARKQHRAYDLDSAWLAEKLKVGKCEQTGIPFSLDFSIKHPFRASIDRIDSSKGYTRDNCQLVCTMYNIAKSDWSDAEVLVMAKSLVRNKK